MAPAPRVSVVMPAHNAGSTIAEAIRSVLAQSMADLELVVCDDASVDDTVAIVQSVQDPRVRLIRNAERRGAGESRNAAIDAARGTWIAVLDADDAFHPMRLERLLEALDHARPHALAFDDILECRHTGDGLVPWRRLRGARAFGASGAPVDLRIEQWIATERLLIKPVFSRDLILRTGIRHSRRGYAEDTEYFLALAAAQTPFLYLPEPLYYYRKTPGSASASPSRHRDMLAVLEAARGALSGLPQAAHALDRRIAHERDMEAYFDFLWHLKRKDAAGAWRIVRRRPRVLKELLARSLRELPCHFGFRRSFQRRTLS